MTLPGGVTLIDLRPEELRRREALPGPALAVTLDAIEDGTHGLTPGLGPLVVVCERGARSGLAARYLRADGLEATAYPGGVPALRRELGGVGEGAPERNPG